MTLGIIQADAFCEGPFSGNPAAVILLDQWLDEKIMLNIAEEINLAETAFLVRLEDVFLLRWFTPTVEVRLCGHATLASAHVLYEHFNYDKEKITFRTQSGELFVSRLSKNHYQMDFPADVPMLIDNKLGSELGLSSNPSALYKGKDDYIAIYSSEDEIRALTPDFHQIAQLNSRGLLATAPGNENDFVSRCFFPQSGVNEDSATGSAHTVLTPLWSQKLNKTTLSALQLSKRKGFFECTMNKDRVLLKGKAVTIIKGEIYL